MNYTPLSSRFPVKKKTYRGWTAVGIIALIVVSLALNIALVLGLIWAIAWGIWNITQTGANFWAILAIVAGAVGLLGILKART